MRLKMTAIILINLFFAAASFAKSSDERTPFSDCLMATHDVINWSDSTKIDVCRRAQDGFRDCYMASDAVIDWSPATRVLTCSHALKGFEGCFEKAQKLDDRDVAKNVNACLGAK